MQKRPEGGYFEGLEHIDYVFVGDKRAFGLLAPAALTATITPSFGVNGDAADGAVDAELAGDTPYAGLGSVDR
jgi:hypothetical protein